MTDRFPRTVGRRAGLDVTLGRRDAALIYELRQEGVRWSLLAQQFGVSADRLMRLMQRCREHGLSWLQKP